MKNSAATFGRFQLVPFSGKIAASSRAVRCIADVNKYIANISAKFLLVITDDREINLTADFFRRIISVAGDSGAGLLYADYLQEGKRGALPHRLNDYQEGSIRADFDFGPVMVFSIPLVKKALKKYGHLPRSADEALYDLRLKISLISPVMHLPELLYSVQDKQPEESDHEKHFAYVAADNFRREKKLEKIATDYLRFCGAFLKSRTKKAPLPKETFPVEASIIIPVLNRENTIADALKSALMQKTDFTFNIIVVDNHSTDNTATVIKKIAKADARVIRLVPQRRDLSIGGCWNEAIYSPHCGRTAVQLDSDDLYSSPDTLRKIVEMLRLNYAMVVGAYTIVNARLKQIPPGLIDHREWTKANGHNNLLRVNGVGAPRAFNTQLLRQLGGFPNVGYGEDYAVALRISREYQIGRIFESLYLCRRWADNIDAAIAPAKKNQNDFYKDKLRTLEIIARRELNKRNAAHVC